MAKTIVWANHKGGVGKTTGAANTSAAHAESGARVLAVDLDPQGHLGELFAVEQHPCRPRLEHVMLRQAPVRDAIVTVGGRLDVLPCSEGLAEAQFAVAAAEDGHHRLLEILEPLQGDYDYVVLDSPPGIGFWSGMALVSAQWAIVPTLAEDLAVLSSGKIARLHRARRRDRKLLIAVARRRPHPGQAGSLAAHEGHDRAVPGRRPARARPHPQARTGRPRPTPRPPDPLARTRRQRSTGLPRPRTRDRARHGSGACMSSMRSGRGARLPGMGAPAAADPPVAPRAPHDCLVGEHAPPKSEHAPAPQPKQRRSSATKDRNTPPTHADKERKRADRAAASEALPALVPRAGEPKVQVNPRIYRGIWRHYEQIVDALPRERRRGALTALVNAVLAQHAPRDAAEARRALAWLRRAEARDDQEEASET